MGSKLSQISIYERSGSSYLLTKQMNKLFDDNFLDALAVVGFIIGVMNYEENLSQSDKDDMMQNFNRKAEELLKKLEDDLEEQNQMLREILVKLDKSEKE